MSVSALFKFYFRSQYHRLLEEDLHVSYKGESRKAIAKRQDSQLDYIGHLDQLVYQFFKDPERITSITFGSKFFFNVLWDAGDYRLAHVIARHVPQPMIRDAFWQQIATAYVLKENNLKQALKTIQRISQSLHQHNVARLVQLLCCQVHRFQTASECADHIEEGSLRENFKAHIAQHEQMTRQERLLRSIATH